MLWEKNLCGMLWFVVDWVVLRDIIVIVDFFNNIKVLFGFLCGYSYIVCFLLLFLG